MEPYPHRLTELARKLRKESTHCESVLWERLRNRRLNRWKFKRQHRIGGYIVDFYCAELKVVVEVEGEIHENPDQREYDMARVQELEDRGLRILRIRNEEVVNNMENALKRILTLSPYSPLPKRERGRG